METKGEHAIKVLQALNPPFTVACQNHFSIAFGSEYVPLTPKLTTQILEVIYLPVEYNAKATALIEHRLMATRRQIDDRKPTVSQPHFEVRRIPFTGIIGASVDHAVSHGPEDFRVTATFLEDLSYEATHEIIASP
jgi:hypothetical protein